MHSEWDRTASQSAQDYTRSLVSSLDSLSQVSNRNVRPVVVALLHRRSTITAVGLVGLVVVVIEGLLVVTVEMPITLSEK